jgi:hypothetical protein
VSGLTALKAAIGKVRVKHVTFDDVTDWQEKLADDGDGSAPKKGRSAKLVGHVRRVFLFGALVLPKEAGCHDVCDVFAKMREAQLLETSTKRREEYMTAAQCRLLRHKAHERGRPSIALQQAIAFELGVRQKDVIGEWIPREYPGLSDVVYGPRKWLLGMRWEEIDSDLILKHRLSKSLRGKTAVMDPGAGKLKAWDLKLYPMVMDELRRIAGKDQFTRGDLPASGSMILNERIGRPWRTEDFSRAWRKIATLAGLSSNIQNRDSRPGAATEADLAGADKDKVRRGLGHAKGETTEIYLRADLEVNSELARLRVEKRQP